MELPNSIDVKVNIEGLQKARNLAEELNKKMQEAKSLAGELQTCISKMKLDIEI